MACLQNESTLCSACRSLTFIELRDGYTHPLTYTRTVLSGKSCQLCRLMVCSMSRLQTVTNSYETNERYDVEADKLSNTPALYRTSVPGIPLFEQEYLLSSVAWSRQQYYGEPGHSSEVRKGNFNDGETIQITASEGSLYGLRNMVPLNSIEPASSPSIYRKLREWVTNCVSEHNECRRHPKESSDHSTPPTRVIDVGLTNDAVARPRLVATNGISVCYVALSHRWAGTNPLKTKFDNLQSHQEELPWESIAPTFRDAIIVTRQLGFRYLWIDSLCIIQDDEEEWKRESRIMGDIFSGACVTIAAVDSVDENGLDHGMLLRHKDPLAVTVRLPFDRRPLSALSHKIFGVTERVYIWKYKWLAGMSSTNDTTYEQNTITLRPRITSLHQRVKRSQWYKRGWILQERLLARRIIYFMKEKVYWSCFSETQEEEGGDPRVAIRTSLFSTSARNSSHRWRTILSEYVRCHITLNSDRLVAVEGISRILETSFSLKVHAGISDEETAESLLWYTKPEPLEKFSDFHAPSWTWASLDGIISFDMPIPVGASSESLVKNLKFDVRSTCVVDCNNNRCKGTCISGQVCFTCPVGNIYRSTRLKDARLMGAADGILSDEALELLLGSAVAYSGLAIPRYDLEGHLVPQSGQRSVPDHTELLIDDYGVCVGFFIPDTERKDDKEVNIVCASITVWRVPRDKRQENDTIEVVGLHASAQSNNLFHRVGRGRIMCNAWLPGCEERDIVVT
ncbi:heterokaryon incompatibility protein [Paraphaeosphaeria sporulosa]